MYGANLDKHDLLMIDDRGRGLSNTIVCDELQHATAPLELAEADCAAQLGTAASRYGTGDIAQDTEAVRRALGYDKVDYTAASYGGADVTAYATRFGQHLRSIMLDSPLGEPDLKAFRFQQYRTQSISRVVSLACLRSPNCSVDHPNAEAELGLLISAIRSHPIEGDAYDANGNLVHVRVDEEALLNFVIANPTGNFVSTGEVLAASAAVSRGDPQPLLRLGAEGTFPLLSDSGDPTFQSAGAAFATMCVDFYAPWHWAAPVPLRMVEYARAVAELPANAFAPFSKAAGTNLVFGVPFGGHFGAQCLWWDKPTPSSPVVPWDEDGDHQLNASGGEQGGEQDGNSSYPDVPTLVVAGDMDMLVPLEETSKVAALFPDSTFITIPGAGHGAALWSQCAQMLPPGEDSCPARPPC